MKKLLLLTALLSLGVAAHAQTTAAQAPPPGASAAPTPDQQATRQAQRLAQALGLSADQQAKVQQILLTQHQSMQAARQQAQAGGRRGAMQAARANRTQADEQLRAVLTPEQYAKYQQLLTQRRAQLRERRQQSQPAGPLD